MEFKVKVKVLAFARYSELLGFTKTELPLPSPPSLGELLKHPGLAALPSDALLAVNQTFVDRCEILHAEDEVALLPPVSGG
jgi:molybdopterin converting factor small subunit